MYLEVPYEEKDEAKALGARWDPQARKWFIPPSLLAEQERFSRWLPQQTTVPSEEDKALSLSQLLTQVEQAVQSAFPQTVWVRAEIAELSISRRGHVYLDLVEYLDSSDVTDEVEPVSGQAKEIARSRATLWKDQVPTLLQKFERETGSQLAVGQKVMLQVRVRFHSRYGFSLQIEDIDPSYTLGDMQAQLRKMRKQLKRQGLYDRNRQLPEPPDFVRVAVIAPPQAAGLGDFRKDAELLEAAGLCEFTYFHAAFQGDTVESDFMAAFDAVEAMHGQRPFDALVILRGGGAQLDLHQLSRLALAERIALAPLPVFTGIGHERDTTLLDEVAHSRFDTPSKVIAHIRDTIRRNALQARDHWRQIQHQSVVHTRQAARHLQLLTQQVRHHARYRLNDARHHLDRLQRQSVEGGRRQLMAHRHAVMQLWARVLHGARTPLQLSKTQLTQLHEQIRQQARQVPTRAMEQIQQWMRFILSAGPERQLRRGFALVRDEQDAVVSTAAQARQQARLTVEFQDGKVETKVIK